MITLVVYCSNSLTLNDRNLLARQVPARPGRRQKYWQCVSKTFRDWNTFSQRGYRQLTTTTEPIYISGEEYKKL